MKINISFYPNNICTIIDEAPKYQSQKGQRLRHTKHGVEINWRRHWDGWGTIEENRRDTNWTNTVTTELKRDIFQRYDHTSWRGQLLWGATLLAALCYRETQSMKAGKICWCKLIEHHNLKTKSEVPKLRHGSFVVAYYRGDWGTLKALSHHLKDAKESLIPRGLRFRKVKSTFNHQGTATSAPHKWFRWFYRH